MQHNDRAERMRESKSINRTPGRLLKIHACLFKKGPGKDTGGRASQSKRWPATRSMEALGFPER